MILICYDISNNRTRLQLSKLLTHHGQRIQFSIFQIDLHNSTNQLIKATIINKFRPKLKKNDSILIINIGDKNKEITRLGKINVMENDFLSLVF